MPRTVVYTILAMLLACAGAHAADRFSVGEWQGEARFAKSGQFSRCTIEGQYRSGITVDFGLTRDYDVEIWLENPAWRSLRKDREYDVEYWIDGYPHQYGTFVSMGNGFGRIDVGNASRSFDQLRAGVRLYVAGIGKTEIFRLDNTYVALGRLLDCVNAELDAERYRDGGANSLSERDPDRQPDRTRSGSVGGLRAGPLFGGSDGSGAKPPAGRDDGAQRPSYSRRDDGSSVPDSPRRNDSGKVQPGTAAQFMGLIFQSRRFAQFHLLDSKDVPGPLRKEEAVWAGPNVLGFANRLTGKPPTEAILERIKRDSESCKDGDFDTGGKAVTLSNGATAYRYTTVCADDQSLYASYAAYPARDGSWYLVGSLGVGSPDGASAADEAIFRFISDAVGG